MDKLCHQIDVLLYDDVNLLDVAGPVQAFSAVNDLQPGRYGLRYVSLAGSAVRSSCGLRLAVDAQFTDQGGQDVLVPGGMGVDEVMTDRRVLDGLAGWVGGDDDRRVISVCSGALILAAAGLLDGRKATTHWGREQQVRALFPAVRWATNELYHIDGRIMTSAGVTAGIDLALEIIRRDCGDDIALMVARELVVYLKRTGGQNQFADLLEAQFSGDRALRQLIDALQADPGHGWTLDDMADAAGLTARTLSRRFTAAFGQSPVKFLERYRVKRASDVLSGGAPAGRAVEVSGFGDFQQMQRAFKRQLGTTIGGYRRNFSASG